MTTLRFDPKPEAARFDCPAGMANHVRRVFEGEYDIAVDFDEPPSILDIGANCGAFALWAATRWETEDIQCYEPHPDTFATLCRNVQRRSQRARCHQVAVTGARHDTPSVWLFAGIHNSGEASLYDLGEQDMASPIAVPWMAAADLPKADIVKIDTEGSELDILAAYDLSSTSAVLLEYHRQSDLVPLINLLQSEGFELCGGEIYSSTRGVLKFVAE